MKSETTNNQDNKIKVAILKAIEEHQAEVSRYKKMLGFLNSDNPQNGDSKPTKRYRVLRRKRFSGRSKMVKQIPHIRWDKLVLPLLDKSKSPLNPRQIADVLGKGRRGYNKNVLKKRICVACINMKKKGQLEAVRLNGRICYKIAHK